MKMHKSKTVEKKILLIVGFQLIKSDCMEDGEKDKKGVTN